MTPTLEAEQAPARPPAPLPAPRAARGAAGVAACAALLAAAAAAEHGRDPDHLPLFLFVAALALTAVLLPATGPRGQRVGLLPAVGLAAALLLPPLAAAVPLMLANAAEAFSRETATARRAAHERGAWLLLAILSGGGVRALLAAHGGRRLAADGVPGIALAALAYAAVFVGGRWAGLRRHQGAERTVRRHVSRGWRLEAVTLGLTAPVAALMALAYGSADLGWAGLCGVALLLALMAVVAHSGFEVAALRDQVRAMEKISAVTVSQTSAPKVIERFLQLSGGLVSCDRVVLWLTDESHTRLERAGAGRGEKGRPDAASVRFGEGLVGRVAERKAALMVRDGAHDPRRVAEESGAGGERGAGGSFSMLLLPLVAGDEAVGVVQFERDAPGAFTARDLSRVQALASQAAAALANVRSHQDVYSQAVTDALTGLFNRRHMQAVLAAERRRAQRYGHPLSVIMLDVDGFKGYNDTYGHVQGDVLLKALSGILREGVRGADTVGRFGGEEFIVVMPETPSAEAYRTAERLRLAVARAPFPGHASDPALTLTKTISLGVATFPDVTRDTQALVALADAALYQAKRGGRNRTVQAEAGLPAAR